MATSEEKVGGPPTDEGVFVDGEMLGPESGDPGQSQPQPDPVIAVPKEVKEEAEGSKKESGNSTNDLKGAFIISGVVVAVIGAIFAIVKKIKEA